MPREPGSEEYLHSEKYQIRTWDLERPESLRYLIARVNEIRRANPALQNDATLHFETIANDQLIAYTKATPDRSNVLIVVVNIDPRYRQSGFVELDLARLGVDARVALPRARPALGRALYLERPTQLRGARAGHGAHLRSRANCAQPHTA